MSNRADRLRKARIGSGFRSASQAARSLGVSPSTYIHHENGTRDFGEDAAVLYSRRFHVGMSWLYLGEGDMETAELALEKERIAALVEEERIEMLKAREAMGPEGYNRIREETERRSQLEAANVLKTMSIIPEISASFSKTENLLSRGWSRFITLNETVQHMITGKWGIPKTYLAFEMGTDEDSAIMFTIGGDDNVPTLLKGDVVVVDTSIDFLVADGLYLIADRTGYPQVRRLKTNLFSEPPTLVMSADREPESKITLEVQAVSIIGKVTGRVTRL